MRRQATGRSYLTVAEGGQSRGRIWAAVGVAVALVGLGVGIGALVWSGDSSDSAPAVALGAAATSDEAPSSANYPKQPKGSKVGNYNVSATIFFENLPDGGVKMNLSQNPDSNCTKDETYGDFDVTNAGQQAISMRVKSDFDEGSCFWEKSWNTWNVSLPGGGGQIMLFEQSTGGADGHHWYEAWCQGTWTGYSCRDDSDLAEASFHKFWIKKN
jgi:hypothetical protein